MVVVVAGPLMSALPPCSCRQLSWHVARLPRYSFLWTATYERRPGHPPGGICLGRVEEKQVAKMGPNWEFGNADWAFMSPKGAVQVSSVSGHYCFLTGGKHFHSKGAGGQRGSLGYDTGEGKRALLLGQFSNRKCKEAHTHTPKDGDIGLIAWDGLDWRGWSEVWLRLAVDQCSRKLLIPLNLLICPQQSLGGPCNVT